MCREVSDSRILLIFHFLNSSKIKANLDKNLQFRNKGRNCLDPAFFFSNIQQQEIQVFMAKS